MITLISSVIAFVIGVMLGATVACVAVSGKE